MDLNPQYDAIGKQFVGHYYELFAQNRAGLGAMYTEQSMLTYEGQQFQGVQSILEKLSKLPVAVKHNVVTCHCQPAVNHGIIVLVNGDVAIEENPPMKFCQVFNLIPNNSGGYAVFNDMFSLCIG